MRYVFKEIIFLEASAWNCDIFDDDVYDDDEKINAFKTVM